MALKGHKTYTIGCTTLAPTFPVSSNTYFDLGSDHYLCQGGGSDFWRREYVKKKDPPTRRQQTRRLLPVLESSGNQADQAAHMPLVCRLLPLIVYNRQSCGKQPAPNPTPTPKISRVPGMLTYRQSGGTKRHIISWFIHKLSEAKVDPPG